MTPSVNIIGGTLAAIGLAAVVFLGVRGGNNLPSAPAVSTVAPPSVAQVLKHPVKKHRAAQVRCGYIPPGTSTITQRYTKEQILAAAAQFGLTPAQISALRTCLN